jgi:hypothetical protein
MYVGDKGQMAAVKRDGRDKPGDDGYKGAMQKDAPR